MTPQGELNLALPLLDFSRGHVHDLQPDRDEGMKHLKAQVHRLQKQVDYHKHKASPAAANAPPPQAANAPPPQAAHAPPPQAANTPPPQAAHAPLPQAAHAPPPQAANAPLPQAANAPPPQAANATPPPAAGATPPPPAAADATDATPPPAAVISDKVLLAAARKTAPVIKQATGGGWGALFLFRHQLEKRIKGGRAGKANVCYCPPIPT